MKARSWGSLYHSPTDAKRWMERCGFKSMAEAYTALEIPYRSWYRITERGLPLGWPGEYLARRMRSIEMRRTGVDPFELV